MLDYPGKLLSDMLFYYQDIFEGEEKTDLMYLFNVILRSFGANNVKKQVPLSTLRIPNYEYQIIIF
jgi:hypothetical protein